MAMDNGMSEVEMVSWHVIQDVQSALMATGTAPDDGTCDPARAADLREIALITPDMVHDPMRWLREQGGIWLAVPAHYRAQLLPVLVTRRVDTGAAEQLTRHLRLAGVRTPGDLQAFIRDATGGLHVPLYAPLEVDAYAAFGARLIRQADPHSSEVVDPMDMAAEAGPQAIFANLFLALGRAQEAPGPEADQVDWVPLVPKE